MRIDVYTWDRRTLKRGELIMSYGFEKLDIFLHADGIIVEGRPRLIDRKMYDPINETLELWVPDFK